MNVDDQPHHLVLIFVLPLAWQAAVLLCTISTYIVTGAGAVHAFDQQWPGSFIDVTYVDQCDFGALRDIPPYARGTDCTLDLLGAIYFSLITSLTVGFGVFLFVVSTRALL